MRIVRNPTNAQLNELIELSAHKAAKWIKAEDGTVFAWPADAMFHAEGAAAMGVEMIDKGIAVPAVTDEARR